VGEGGEKYLRRVGLNKLRTLLEAERLTVNDRTESRPASVEGGESTVRMSLGLLRAHHCNFESEMSCWQRGEASIT
jgi:hypothetical protein